MRKIRKLSLIVLALVLVMCCVLTGCNKNKHEHSYSQIGYDETNHWNYCPDDQTKDEASVAPHTYKWESNDSQHWQVCTVCGYIVANSYANHIDSDENGKCDVCEHTVPVPIKYGSFSGTIKLHKQGNLTASGDGVTVAISQGETEVKPSDLVVNADGTFSFTAIEGEYTLAVSKGGYKTVSNDIELSKADPVTGYEVVLEYNLMSVSTVPGFDKEQHDFAHQNDENSYVSFNCEKTGMTLNAMTVDVYDDASFTYITSKDHKSNSDSRAGVMVQFYNEADSTTDFVWWNIKTDDGKGDLVEWYSDSLWDTMTNFRCLTTNLWNTKYLTAEESAQYEAGKLEIGVARHENMIFGLVNGKVRDTIVLDEKYADMDAHFALICWDVVPTEGGNKFYFEINEGIEDILPTDTFTVALPEVEHLTITSSRENGIKGQGIIIEAVADEGYELSSLKVGDTEYASQLVDGKIEIANYNGEAITASVVDAKPVTAVISAEGWNGAELIFTRGDNVKNVTVADGKATFEGLTGPWAVSTVYMGKTFDLGTIIIDGEGKATFDSTIVMFSGLDIYGWNGATSTFNPATGKGTITQTAGNMIINESAVSYQKVAITQYVKADLTDERTGVFVKIGKQYVLLNIKHSGNDKGVIEWACDGWDQYAGTGVENITESTWDKASFSEYCSWGNWCMFNENLELMYRNDSADDHKLTTDELKAFDNGELKLTLVRDGANIYAFVNDHFIGSRCLTTNDVVDEDDAEGDVTVGAFGCGLSIGTTFNYQIETDISAYTAKLGESNFKYTVNGENIKVTGKTEGYSVGDVAKIEIAPAENYEIVDVKVNGESIGAQSSIARYILSKTQNGVVVDVETVLRAPISAVVSAKGWNGAKLTFTQGEIVKTATVENDEATFEGITGTWTITTEYRGKSYDLGEVTFGIDGKATLEGGITIFSDTDIYGWNNATNTFNPISGEGTFTQTKGDFIKGESLISFDKVAITQYVKVDVASEKSGVFVKFGKQYVLLIIKHSGNDKGVIEWDCDTTYDGWSGGAAENITKSTWDNASFSEYCSWGEWCMFNENLELMYRNDSADDHKLTADELTAFGNGTLKLTLVRDGANLYAFVNDHFIGSRCLTTNGVLSEEDANKEMNVGVFGQSLTVGTVLNYKLETDISAYTAKLGESTFKFDVKGDHVTAKNDWKVGDVAKLELIPDKHFEITSIKVNGESVALNASIARYIMSKTQQDVVIEVETKEYKSVTINATIAESLGYNGLVLALANRDGRYTATIADNKATIEGYEGPHTIYVVIDGVDYEIGDVTIDSTGTLNISEDVKIINFFNKDDIWGWGKTVTSEYDYKTGKGTVTLTGDNLIHETANGYDSFAITHYLKKDMGGSNWGAFVKFGNNYVWFNLKNNMSIEWNCEDWQESWGMVNKNYSKKTFDGFGPNEYFVFNEKGETMYQTGNNFTDEDKSLYESGEFKLTLVRHGSMVYAFINDRYIGFRNMGEGYENVKATAGLISREVGSQNTYNYLFETDITKYLAICEAESSFKYEVSGEHYQVNGKTEGFNVSDYAEVSFTAEDGYVITSIKVDGVEVEDVTASIKRWVNSANLANVKIEITTELANASVEE